MPKKLEEIKGFQLGLVSSPSSLDTPNNAATYSSNISPNLELGALTGIYSDKLLSSSGFEIPRYSVFRIKLLEHSGSFNVNNYQRQWFHWKTYGKTYFVWLAQDSSTTSFSTASTSAEYLENTLEGQEDVRIELTAANNIAEVAVLISNKLKTLGPESSSYLYKSVSTTWFACQGEVVLSGDTAGTYIKCNSLYYGEYNFDLSSNGANHVSQGNYITTSYVEGDVIGTGLGFELNASRDFKFAKIIDKGEKHSLIATNRNKIFYIDNLYSNTPLFKDLDNSSIVTSSDYSISSVERNNNIYLGTGNTQFTKSKWIGEINRKQLDTNHDGVFIEDSECKGLSGTISENDFDQIVVPLLHSGMNSANSMIAGAASLYGSEAAGTDFGGDDLEADVGSGVNHRSLNGWIMKCLANASAAFQSNGITAANDDSNFYWSSVKRGMILRVNIGEEGDATKHIARNEFSGSGAPATGSAIVELKRIKEIGYCDTSAVDTAAQEGAELHDGDLFQVVTVPSGAATGHDANGASNGNVVTYPRLIYVGSTIGNNTDHNSTNAHHGAPAWSYAVKNDGHTLSRIALSECNDVDITSENVSSTFSTSGATGATTSNTEFLKRITTIDLRSVIDEDFTIGTIANCVSTDGEGGINGRVGMLKTGFITGVANSSGNITFTVQDAASSGSDLAHGYMVGDWVTISNLHSDHNGVHQITAIPETHTFTCVTGGINTGDTAGNVIGHTRNYYAGHGKLWLTSSNHRDKDRLFLIDVVNWHGDDADNNRVTYKEFSLNFTRIHSKLWSSIDGQGLVEEPYWSKYDPNAENQDTEVTWVDREWQPATRNSFVGSICETYSHQPHLDDGASTGAGLGRWRVWLSFNKTDNTQTFNKWDLFLFNIRPTELKDDNSNTAYMYDKTPPYQECGQLKMNMVDDDLYEGSDEPVYFPKDKFMMTSGLPVRRTAAPAAQGDGGIDNTFSNTATDYQHNYNMFDRNQWSALSFNNDKTKVNIINATVTQASGAGSAAVNYNTAGLGLHCFVKGDEETEINMGINPSAAGGSLSESLNRTEVFRDGTDKSYNRNHSFEYGMGGPMFKDPSGMWHHLMAPDNSMYYDNYHFDNQIDSNHSLSAVSTFSLGSNTGWLNSSFTDNKNPRTIKVTRHSLTPLHSHWFNTSSSDATQEYTTAEGTASKVAHQVNLVTSVSGKFVTRGGMLNWACGKDRGEGLSSSATNSQPFLYVKVPGSLKNFNNTHVMYQVHDSPCAFSPFPASGSDAETGNTLTKWDGTHEIQGRPSNATGTDDVSANFNVDKAVAPSLGFSGYNQYRWGHGKNGTDDIDASYNGQADYTGDSLWINWKGYTGKDSYGHYTNITTTWSSVCDGSYIPFKGLANPILNFSYDNKKRLRNFNSAYGDAYGPHLDDATLNIAPNTNFGNTTKGSVDGTGYFTWHLNSHATDSSGDAALKGWYPSSGGYVMADSAASDVLTAGNSHAPLGQKWDNRRIVQCWSTLEGDAGWMKNAAIIESGVNGSRPYVTKNPRCTMKILDKAFASYDSGEEAKEFLKIHNVDSVPVYDTNVNKMTAFTLISGHIQDDDRALNMVGVYNNFRGSTYGTAMNNGTLGRVISGARPAYSTSAGTRYNHKRCYFNEKLFFKNIAPASFLADNTYDIYTPILTGHNKNNSKISLSTWRRGLSTGWAIADNTLQTVESPGFSFDRFYNQAAVDLEAFPYGLDNSADSSVTARFPTEGTSSTAGVNEGETESPTVDNSTTIDGAHIKSLNEDFFELSLLGTETSDASDFKLGDIIEYKISLLYDGFQDSPLSNQTWKLNEGIALDANYKGVSLLIRVPNANSWAISKRVTSLLIWRRNNEYEQFRYVNEIDLENTTGVTDDEGRVIERIVDKGSFESYKNIVGISENIKETSLNYSISAQLNDFLFVSGAFHPRIKESQNFIFRSKPGKFSIFDWSTDFISMPTKPIALASFGGKLYVFSRQKLYRLDPDGLFIENVMDGIGILNPNSLVVTDFGMFFCDHNNMYMHDGSVPKAIGGTVLENTDNPEWSIGYRRAVKKALSKGFSTFVQFDARNKCVYFIIQGYSYGVSSYIESGAKAYSYHFETGRYDYYDVPPLKSTTIGKDGDVLLFDGYQIWSYRTNLHTTRAWDWDSKIFDLGTIAQRKVFKSIKLTGSVTIENLINSETDNVLVYLDGIQQKMTVENKNHYITKPIAGYTANQNWNGMNDADTGGVYTINSALSSLGGFTLGANNTNSFLLNPDSMPEFVSGNLTNQIRPVAEGEIETLKYISKGQYLVMSMKNSVSKSELLEIVKVKDIKFYWTNAGLIKSVEVICERGQLGTRAVDFHTILMTQQNWLHSSIRYTGISLKFPSASKGRIMQIKLKNQKGIVDSISIIYRGKSVK